MDHARRVAHKGARRGLAPRHRRRQYARTFAPWLQISPMGSEGIKAAALKYLKLALILLAAVSAARLFATPMTQERGNL